MPVVRETYSNRAILHHIAAIIRPNVLSGLWLSAKPFTQLGKGDPFVERRRPSCIKGKNLMSTPSIHSLIQHFDSALRVLNGVGQPARLNPATPVEEQTLSETEQKVSARLMRVNHAGEICAQALYLGQGFTSKDPHVKETMLQAAKEETDHLLWCEARLTELDARKSYLNPLFYTLSFVSGAVSGLLGNRFNLGFVAATEEQVVKHLEEHLKELPVEDERSKAILEQMKLDEDEHRTNALSRGGMDFPTPVKTIMTVVSKLMTRTTYWV